MADKEPKFTPDVEAAVHLVLGALGHMLAAMEAHAAASPTGQHPGQMMINMARGLLTNARALMVPEEVVAETPDPAPPPPPPEPDKKAGG